MTQQRESVASAVQRGLRGGLSIAVNPDPRRLERRPAVSSDELMRRAWSNVGQVLRSSMTSTSRTSRSPE